MMTVSERMRTRENVRRTLDSVDKNRFYADVDRATAKRVEAYTLARVQSIRGRRPISD